MLLHLNARFQFVDFQMSVWKEANIIDCENKFIFEGQTVILEESHNFSSMLLGCLYVELLPEAMIVINVKWFFKTSH